MPKVIRFRCAIVLALLLHLGNSGCEGPAYNLGYQAGKSDVRKARQEGGLGTRMLIHVIPAPERPGKPAEWNAGYRQGWADELEKP